MIPCLQFQFLVLVIKQTRYASLPLLETPARHCSLGQHVAQDAKGSYHEAQHKRVCHNNPCLKPIAPHLPACTCRTHNISMHAGMQQGKVTTDC